MNIHRKVMQSAFFGRIRMTFFGGASSKIYMKEPLYGIPSPAFYSFGDIPRPVCCLATSIICYLSFVLISSIIFRTSGEFLSPHFYVVSS